MQCHLMFTASNEVGIPVIAQREHNFFTIPKQSACSVKKSTDLASKDVVPGVLSRKLRPMSCLHACITTRVSVIYC